MAVQKITYGDKQYLNQNADIPATNKVQDTDMNEIKSVVNNNANELNNLMPTILYDNSNGSNTTITLSDSAANYSFLEIYFTDNNKGFVDFKKIKNPNNKSIGMNLVSTTASHGTFVRTCTFTINNDTITPNYWTYYTVNTNNTIAGYSYSTNYVYITKVIGYK